MSAKVSTTTPAATSFAIASRNAIASPLVRKRSRTGAVASAVPTNGFDLQCPCSMPQANMAAATLRVRRTAASPPVARALPRGPVLTSTCVFPSIVSRIAREASALLRVSMTFCPINGRMWRLRFDPSETQLLGLFDSFVASSAKYRSISSDTVNAAFAALFFAFGSSPSFARDKASRAAFRASSGVQGDPCSPIV